MKPDAGNELKERERERDKISNRDLDLDLNDSEPNLVDSKSRSDSDRDADFENEGDYLELKFSNLESDLESDSSGNAKLCYSYSLIFCENQKPERNWRKIDSEQKITKDMFMMQPQNLTVMQNLKLKMKVRVMRWIKKLSSSSWRN